VFAIGGSFRQSSSHASNPIRSPTPIHRNPTPSKPTAPIHHTPTHPVKPVTPIHHTPTPPVKPISPIHHNPTTPHHPTQPSKPVAPGNYPHFSQGDPRWKGQTLGHGGSTIGAKGCLMSSVASMVAGRGGQVNGASPNPQTMNKWLQGHGGFQGANFVWDSLKPLGFKFEGKVSGQSHITNALNSGKNVLLNVNGGHHYVLATGVTPTGYKVMDPGFSKTEYKFGEVVSAGVYSH